MSTEMLKNNGPGENDMRENTVGEDLGNNHHDWPLAVTQTSALL